jgi:transposase-like protein
MHQPTVQHLPAIAHRGVDVSYETVRAWTMKFWPKIATNLRRRELPPSPR